MKDEISLFISRTLALKSVHSGKYFSKIITMDGIYFSTLKPIDLLNKACLRHHSSKAGRKEAAKELLKYRQKTPFLISDEVGVFPTNGSKNPDCIWIFSHFFDAKRLDSKNTLLTFNNEITINVPVSLYTVTKQKTRLHTLLSHVQYSKNQYISEQSLFGVKEEHTKYDTESTD
ncbi:competence protein ComK [Sporosarcina thermotolerans]|uniref:Competence protein ComK n=1 Tax=Sporosarcina thermotolerans TaxID=633404 RepID=A0AAW9A5M7_9BACL|nr:competence protein ComK [Sporosarcina thermotolerans]MDW0116229.1 competence protein ComK [Sporosarcina thermotolerans]WHT48202.1 competence protein ComK [Sporosarcina thermotolerans]